MIVIIIKAKVCVICRSRRLTHPFLWISGKSNNVSAVGSRLSFSLLVIVLGDVTSACIKLLSVGMT